MKNQKRICNNSSRKSHVPQVKQVTHSSPMIESAGIKIDIDALIPSRAVIRIEDACSLFRAKMNEAETLLLFFSGNIQWAMTSFDEWKDYEECQDFCGGIVDLIRSARINLATEFDDLKKASATLIGLREIDIELPGTSVPFETYKSLLSRAGCSPDFDEFKLENACSAFTDLLKLVSNLMDSKKLDSYYIAELVCKQLKFCFEELYTASLNLKRAAVLVEIRRDSDRMAA